MEARNVLLFQKGNGNVVNSYTTWNIVCSKVPFKAGGKTKEFAENDWHDEHGKEVYYPQKAMFEAYDAEFVMAYKGQELATNPFNLSLALTKIDSFKKWLSGNNSVSGTGTQIKVYSPYSTIGRICHLLEIGDESPVVMTKEEKNNIYHENVVTFKVKFRVDDPMTDVTLVETSSSS